MSGDYQPYCDDCLVPLTVQHLLVECARLGELRQRMLFKCQGEDAVYRLSKVLGPACPSPGYDVLVFFTLKVLFDLIYFI